MRNLDIVIIKTFVLLAWILQRLVLHRPLQQEAGRSSGPEVAKEEENDQESPFSYGYRHHRYVLPPNPNTTRPSSSSFNPARGRESPKPPLFLTGHPKRLLSLDDLVGIRRNDLHSLLGHHRIHNVRSELNALFYHHNTPTKVHGSYVL